MATGLIKKSDPEPGPPLPGPAPGLPQGFAPGPPRPMLQPGPPQQVPPRPQPPRGPGPAPFDPMVRFYIFLAINLFLIGGFISMVI